MDDHSRKSYDMNQIAFSNLLYKNKAVIKCPLGKCSTPKNTSKYPTRLKLLLQCTTKYLKIAFITCFPSLFQIK